MHVKAINESKIGWFSLVLFSIYQLTRGTSKLVSKEHTWKICVARGANVRGNTPSNIWNIFTLQIERSICIRRLAISCVSNTWSVVNCGVAPRKGGMTSLHFSPKHLQLIKNPLSAITVSFSSSRSKSPEFMVMCESDALPPQTSETKEITPEGVMPTRNFSVVVFIVWEC